MNETHDVLERLRLSPSERKPQGKRLVAAGTLSVGLLVITLTGVGMMRTKADPTAELASSGEPVASPAVDPTPVAANPGFSASGYLIARRKAVVAPVAFGRVASLSVEEGDTVKIGQPLARLEDIEERTRLLRAEAAVEGATMQLTEERRQLLLRQRLLAEGLVARDEVDALRSRARIANAALKVAEAELRLAESQLAKRVIRAPFSGTVVEKLVEIGEAVGPSPSTPAGPSGVVAITDLSSLELEVDISENRVASLFPGQTAEVVLDAFPGRRYTGRIRQILPSADRSKATVEARVALDALDASLLPDMSGRVTFLPPES